MVGRHLPDNKVHLGPSKNDVQSKGAYMAVLIGCVIRTVTEEGQNLQKFADISYGKFIR